MKNQTVKFNFSRILKEKNLTQKKASVLTGIHKNGISVLAGEPTKISFQILTKICKGLNVSPADLFTLE